MAQVGNPSLDPKVCTVLGGEAFHYPYCVSIFHHVFLYLLKFSSCLCSFWALGEQVAFLGGQVCHERSPWLHHCILRLCRWHPPGCLCLFKQVNFTIAKCDIETVQMFSVLGSARCHWHLKLTLQFRKVTDLELELDICSCIPHLKFPGI